MLDRPRIALLPDGKRLHMRHGPIDLVIEATGAPGEVEKAYQQAAKSFTPILPTLSAELAALRKPIANGEPLQCSIAKAMRNAAQHCCGETFATPMIAVAGAVADHVLTAMVKGRALGRAYVNNGGDIALYLAEDATFTVGLCAQPDTGRVSANAKITARDTVRGIATSGWRGRSHSLGIADAVTVLAKTAAVADAAATTIANAIDLPSHPAVTRAPANALSPDSDLGDRLVTTGVGPLSVGEKRQALASGKICAEQLIAAGKIVAAHATLGGQTFAAERAVPCLTS